MRPEWVSQFSLAPECLVTSLCATFFGGAAGVPWWGRYFSWEMNAYVGAGALALACAGALSSRGNRHGWRLAMIAVILILLALGRHTALIHLLPLGGMFRGAAKFLMPAHLMLALLAGLGAHGLFTGGERDVRRSLVTIVLLACAALVLLLVVAGGDTLLGARDMVMQSGESLNPAASMLGGGDLRHAALRGAITALCVLVALTAVVALLLGARWRAGRWAPMVVCLLVAGDMLCFGRMFVTGDALFRTEPSWPAGAVEALHQHGRDYRVMAVDDPNLNDGMLNDTLMVEGIEPNPPVRFHALFRLLQDQPLDIAPSLYQVRSWRSVAKHTALARLLAPRNIHVHMPDSRELWSKDGTRLLQKPESLPRAFVVANALRSEDMKDSLTTTRRTDISHYAVIEGLPPDDLAAIGEAVPEAAPARVVDEGPNQVSVFTDAEWPGWLVLRDNWFPGWQATLDGAPVDIFPADMAFRGVRVPAGLHTVTFTYRPRSLTAGAWMSFISLAASLLTLGAFFVKNREKAARRLENSHASEPDR